MLASILAVSGTFQQILSYFLFVTVLFVGFTVGGLFVLRLRDGPDTPYRTPGYPWTPVIFLTLTAVMLAVLAGHSPLQAAAGTGIVALGAPVYLLLFRRRV